MIFCRPKQRKNFYIVSNLSGENGVGHITSLERLRRGIASVVRTASSPRGISASETTKRMTFLNPSNLLVNATRKESPQLRNGDAPMLIREFLAPEKRGG